MWQDLKLALRSLARTPGYTATVVGMLALGMGAAAALHSNLAQSAMMYDYPDVDRLVRLENKSRDNPFPAPLWLGEHLLVRERMQTVTSIAGGTGDSLNLVINGEPEGVAVARVTANFFRTLGVPAMLGRTFVAGEDEPGRDGVAVLTFWLWRDRFGRDPDVVGRTVLLNERSYEVIGVLPEEFRPLPGSPAGRLYVPYQLPAVTTPQNVLSGFATVARLRPGVTLQQAEAELRTMQLDVNAAQLEFLKRFTLTVSAANAQPDVEALRRFNSMRLVSTVAVACLYLIGCVNAGSLMLVRALARKREVGIRLALGGGRWEVAKPLFAEALVLSAAAVGLGMMVAKWLMPALLAIAPGAEDQAFRAITLRWDTLAFLAGLGVLTGTLVASGPAWRTARMNVNDAMKDSSAGGGESRRTRAVRAGLVIVEAALAVALLAGTGLMIRTFQRLLDYDPGFEPKHRYRLSLQLSREERLSNAERLERYKQVVERLKQVPGVTSASMSGFFTPTSFNPQKIKLPGQPEAGEVEAQGHMVDGAFLELLGLPVRAGRPMSDLRQGDPVSVVVTESFAKNYFPGRNPVGEVVEISPREKWQIHGVVGDIRSARVEPKPRYFFPYWQRSGAGLSLVSLSLAGPPGPKFNSEVRRAVYEVEPKFALTSITEYQRQLQQEVGMERFIMVVLEVLAGLALMLAVLGLFAMMAYSVVQRRKEFGVRLTFGATPESIRWLVIGAGLRLAGIGVLCGLALAVGLARLMESMLFNTKGWDPVVFVSVAVLMFAVAWPACWFPARAAAKVDVARLLRPE